MIQIPIADEENPSVLGGYTCMRVYVCMASDLLDFIELLHRLSYAHTNSHKCILVLGKMAHLVRWWLFYTGIPHGTWHWNVLESLSHCLMCGCEDQVTTVCHCLLQQLAFSESCHICWDIFLPNTMALDRWRHLQRFCSFAHCPPCICTIKKHFLTNVLIYCTNWPCF
jgi:hypothetical protein